MSEQIPPRPGFPHPNSGSGYPESTNSGGFVVVDDSEDQIRQPVEHEEPEGRETSRNRALTGSESAAEASVGQHQGIFQLEEERSTQTERRWRQWRSNSLSEGKIMALDRLQNRLRVILAVNEDLEHPETPRQIGVHRNLRDAQTEPREENRHSVHSFKSASDAAPTNEKISETNGSRTEGKSAQETRVLRSLERSSSLPRIIGESCLSRTRRDSCQSGLKLSRLSALGRDEQRKQLPTRDRAPAKPLRNRDFRREENEGADRIARDYFEGREYPRSRSLSSGNSPGNHHRCQNEYYQNLCELCHFPVPVFQPLTIELRGSYYHKRCLVDLFFTKEELYAALRARCRAHLRTRDARAEGSPAWRRIFGKISKLFKGN